MSANRKPIPKSVRFEVFKRDDFTCRYCGRKPPVVILEIDHVIPVAGGGTADETNLVTACFDCNRGKSDRPLNIAPEPLSDRAAMILEAEAQIAAYREAVDAREARREEEVWDIVRVLFGGDETTNARFNSILMFLGRLPYDEVLCAAQLASARVMYGGPRLFTYFCGICWNKIRAAEEAA